MTRRSGSSGPSGAAKAGALLEAPERVPGYRNLKQIGYGGFSVVYRAVQESVDRAVALKVLTVSGSDDEARRRFVREVKLTGRLSGHPHVVTVFDTGTTASGRPFLAMDLYDGGSMKEWLARRGPLGPAQAALLGAKIGEALAAAHELGVLHRDVKPNNILVSRYGEPALADFGVSCLLDAGASGSVLDIFSPQHAAPELMTRGEPSAASDVYALGSTLYELLTGRPPFSGPGQDVRTTMFRTVSEPAPRPDCPELPELADAVERAMAKDPADRFPDAATFARELRILIPEGTVAALTGAGASVAGAGPAASAASAASAESGAADMPGPRRELAVRGAADTTGQVADLTDEMYVYSASDDYVPRADETMVRPDRVDRDPAAADGGRGRRGGGGSGERRAGAGAGAGRFRKPLAVVAGVGLVAGVVWAVAASQGSSAPHDHAAAQQGTPSTSSSESASTSATQGTPSPTPTHSTSTPSPSRHSSSGTPSHAPVSSVTSASAGLPPSGPVATSSSQLPPLSGTYHRFQNAQSGDCLAQPAGSGTAAHQGCAASRSQGWEYSVPLTGILGAVTGQFELVNADSGQCLTGGAGGTVSTGKCTGAPAQAWVKTGGSGSATQFKNIGDGKCLKTTQGSVTEGTCGSGDSSGLWTENGTVS